MVDELAAHFALRAQLLGTPGLPTARAFENIDFEPTVGVPYIEEEYVPTTNTLRGLVRGGTTEETGLYVVRWYGVANTGSNAISIGARAILARFTPGSTLTTTAGDVLHIRGDSAPWRGQIRPAKPGWAMCTITIPFRCYTNNPA